MPRTGLTQAELRSAALDAAEAAIRRYGIDKCRLVDVAKQLGVSHAALYKLFRDKNALMDAVSDRWLLDTEAELAKIVRAGDVILVKGSRGVRTEKVIEKLLEKFELEDDETAMKKTN